MKAIKNSVLTAVVYLRQFVRWYGLLYVVSIAQHSLTGRGRLRLRSLYMLILRQRVAVYGNSSVVNGEHNHEIHLKFYPLNNQKFKARNSSHL